MSITTKGLPENYRDNITVDNGVEIVWVNQKGQLIPPPSADGPDGSHVQQTTGKCDPSLPVAEETPAAVVAMSPGGSCRKSEAGTVSTADLIGPWFTNPPEGSAPNSPPSSPGGPPENEEDDDDPEGHPCMALEPYAALYYLKPKGLLPKKRTLTETLLSWKGKQITSPLTMACQEPKALFAESVAAFGTIMGYMGDKKTRESGIQLLKSLQMRVMEGCPEFKDEVICQVHLL